MNRRHFDEKFGYLEEVIDSIVHDVRSWLFVLNEFKGFLKSSSSSIGFRLCNGLTLEKLMMWIHSLLLRCFFFFLTQF